MKTLSHALALTASLLLLPGCDAEEQCVADCQAESSTGSSTGTPADDESSSTEDPADESTGQGSQICDEITAEAMAFVDQNKACETVLDCTLINAICFAGAEACGSVALSADANLAEWGEYEAMMSGSCQCGADPCGASVMCNEANECEATWLSPDYCPSIEQDIQTFLAANRACEVDEDCMALASSCYVDECSIVAVNVDTNADDWATLDGLLGQCDAEDPDSVCNFVGDCGPEIRCGDAGQCEAVF